MSAFKIVNESIVDYTDDDQLYLMIILYKEKYYVVVDSRTARIGNVKAHNRKEADVMFNEIEARMRAYSDLWKILEMFKIAFSMKSKKQFMFIVNILNTEQEFNSIWKLKFTYACVTSPMITDLIYEDKTYDHTIHISFPGNEYPLGYFRAPDAESRFTFYVSDFFMNKI